MVRTSSLLAAFSAGLLAAFALAGCGKPSDNASKQNTEQADDTVGGAPAPPISAEQLGPVATPEQQALYAGDFEAVGAEPNWRLDLLADWASFTRPGLNDVGGMPTQRDFRAQGARIVAGPLTIVLKAETCAHEGGGSFPYTAIVNFDGVPYEGCARRGANQAAADSDWTSVISQLVPAIDSCLAKADKKPARVTIAYLLDGGQAGVRVLDAEGGRYECNAPVGGGAVTYWDSIGDRDVMQGERAPMFTRAPTAPPTAGPCQQNTPAKTSAGATIGWLSRKTC